MFLIWYHFCDQLTRKQNKKQKMVKLQKMRRIFKMRNIARHRNDPERMPLTQASTSSFSLARDRSPSIDSMTNSSTSSTETQTRRSFRSYGSFLPNYFNILRNSLRRSNSSQVRWMQMIMCVCISSKWKNAIEWR